VTVVSKKFFSLVVAFKLAYLEYVYRESIEEFVCYNHGEFTFFAWKSSSLRVMMIKTPERTY